ncbi:hypothetical protein PV336_13290 [Streptomyces sp. MI02-2A]|nr:hypothetical protein [Streptomyces sp. MI02-2A]
MLIYNAQHARRVRAEYAEHDNSARPHRALQLRAPADDPDVIPFPAQHIRRHDVLSGLIHEFRDTARRRSWRSGKRPAQRMCGTFGTQQAAITGQTASTTVDRSTVARADALVRCALRRRGAGRRRPGPANQRHPLGCSERFHRRLLHLPEMDLCPSHQ